MNHLKEQLEAGSVLDMPRILFPGCENVAGHLVQYFSDNTKEKIDDVDHTAYPVDSDTRCSRGSKH